MPGILNITISGLNDAVLRAANAASNIVNASSTGKLPTVPGGKSTAFAPQDVITTTVDGGGGGLGVTSSLKPRNPSYVTVSDPKSPDANAQGLVAAPNVDISAEIVTGNEASFIYSANAAVIKIEEKMQKALLDTTK